MSGQRYLADDLKGREGAVLGPEANAGEGGTILYVCDTVGDKPAQHALAKRIADALNAEDEREELMTLVALLHDLTPGRRKMTRREQALLSRALGNRSRRAS